MCEEAAVRLDVTIEERRGTGAWGRTRRATLGMCGHDDSETRTVPVAVGRAMLAWQREVEDAGEDLTERRIRERLDDVMRQCARKHVARLVGRRDYSVREIHDKLTRAGYDEPMANEVASWAEYVGYVDNRRFAGAFSRTKLAAGWGLPRIEQELRRRGIDVTELDGWPEEFVGDNDERDRALVIARRKYRVGPHAFERMVRHLAARGFSSAVAFDVARVVSEERGHDEADF